MKTIKMQTESGKTADVHPDMVEEYKKGGFIAVADKPAPKKLAAKKTAKSAD